MTKEVEITHEGKNLNASVVGEWVSKEKMIFHIVLLEELRMFTITLAQADEEYLEWVDIDTGKPTELTKKFGEWIEGESW